MHTTHFRNSKHIYRKQVTIAFIFLLASASAFAQSLNKPFYDYSRRIHFGFTIGANYSRFNYELSNNFYHQPKDTVWKVTSKGYPGLTLGAVINLHPGSYSSFIREHFDIRLIPSLVLAQRRLVYTFSDGSTQFKEVESAMVEAPLLIKFKSDRLGNFRFYVIGGGNYGYDLSSNAKAAKDPANPKVAVYPSNFNYEYGAGLDLYFPYFKFSPEIKVSKGINNVLAPDPAFFTNIFSSFKSNFIYFSMYFEG